MCLTFNGNRDKELIGYVDANWNSVQNSDGKSTSGYIFTMNGTAITWRSIKQSVIAMSTCEAEYIGICEAVKEGIWISNILEEIGIKNEYIENGIVLNCDNQSAIAVAKNKNSRKSKHIELKYLKIRSEIENKRFKMEYIQSSNQIADYLTKGVSHFKCEKFNNLVNLTSDIHQADI